jgi:hypothetical protein
MNTVAGAMPWRRRGGPAEPLAAALPPLPMALSPWWQQATLLVALHALFLVFDGSRTEQFEIFQGTLLLVADKVEWMGRLTVHVALAVGAFQLIDRLDAPRRWRWPAALALIAVAGLAGAAFSVRWLPFVASTPATASPVSDLALFWYALWLNLLIGLSAWMVIDSLRRRQQATRELAAAQEHGRQVREDLAAAQLLAIQARVDPQLLFDVLATVKRWYASDPERAERLLDDLTDFLRAALPRLRSAHSLLEVEFGLVQRYARLQRDAGGAEIEVQGECPADLARARFPAGVLLPLLGAALGTTRRAALTAAARAGSLAVRLTLAGPPSGQRLQSIRSSLVALYGDAATLTATPHGVGWQCVLEVPLEFA